MPNKHWLLIIWGWYREVEKVKKMESDACSKKKSLGPDRALSPGIRPGLMGNNANSIHHLKHLVISLRSEGNGRRRRRPSHVDWWSRQSGRVSSHKTPPMPAPWQATHRWSWYTPHEGLNLANRKSQKFGVFGRKFEGRHSLLYSYFDKW